MASQSTYSKPDNLNDRQWLFCLEYVKDLNRTKAALRAGYSPDSAAAIGWENLQKPEIEDAVANLAKGRHAKIGLTAEFLLQEALRIASHDILDAFDPETNALKDLRDIDTDTRRAIASVKIKALYDDDGKKIGETQEVKFYDKTKGIDLCGRHLALWLEREIERHGEEFAFEGDIGARLSDNPDLTKAFLADLFGKTKQTANGSSNGAKPAKNGHGAN